MSEAQEVRAGLQAAAMALAGMALQQERIADMLAEWDKRAAWAVPHGLAGGGVFAEELKVAPAWAKAAAELREAIAPSSEDIRAALAKLETRAR